MCSTAGMTPFLADRRVYFRPRWSCSENVYSLYSLVRPMLRSGSAYVRHVVSPGRWFLPVSDVIILKYTVRFTKGRSK